MRARPCGHPRRVQRRGCRSRAATCLQRRRSDVGDKGKKAKGKKEQQRSSKLSPKEKRKLKKEKSE